MNEKRQSEKQGEKIKLLFKKVTSPKAGINLSDSLK